MWSGVVDWWTGVLDWYVGLVHWTGRVWSGELDWWPVEWCVGLRCVGMVDQRTLSIIKTLSEGKKS